MSIPGRYGFETVSRKLRRSYERAGMLPTLQRCFSTPFRMLAYSIRDLLPRERRFRKEEFNFDRRHNVETRARRDPGWMSRISSPNWMHGISYFPVPADVIERILNALEIDYTQFVFVDLGAGKGRAILMAAQFPFKRIVGVEYSPTLAGVMTKNIAAYRNPLQRCVDLEGRLQDAMEFELPHEPLVLFFHHPFENVIFRQVRERIEQSLLQQPRDIYVIYYDPQCGKVFDESPHFRVLQRGVAERKSASSSDWIVYEACPVSVGGY